MVTGAKDQYPISSQDQQAIPLEVVCPLSLTQWTLVKNTPQSVTIPTGELAWVYSTVDVILRMDSTDLPAALVDGTTYPNSMIIPAGALINLKITAGAARLLPLADGILFLNVIVQWGSLTQKLQSAIG